MKMALQVRNKWRFVDGTMPIPARDHPNFEAWERCNVMVSSWLLKSVSASIAQSVLYIDLASEILEDLSKRFSQADPHRISDLQDEIYNLKQGSHNINDYYTNCKILWEEMSILRPLPVCNCDSKCVCGLSIPKCNCGLIAKIMKERDEDYVIRFLKGLNDEYSSIKSSVLMIEPIPPVHKVFGMAIKLERQIHGVMNSGLNEIMHANVSVGESQNEEVVAAVNNYNNSGNYNNRKKFGFNGTNSKNAKCTYCGMTGHTIERCYKKYGYPPGWVPGYKSKNKQPQNQGFQVNAASGNSNKSASPNLVGADIGIITEQFQRFMTMLQQNSQGNSTAANITTSGLTPNFTGATSHLSEGEAWYEDGWFC